MITNDKSRRTREFTMYSKRKFILSFYGQTNDVLGKGYGTWNSNDGTSQGFGTVLRFYLVLQDILH